MAKKRIKFVSKMNYNKVRELLAELEHEQWMYWSKDLVQELKYMRRNILIWGSECAVKLIDDRLKRWGKNWKPYTELSKEVKDLDLEWADKVLDSVYLMRCPVYQCGGFMKTVERAYPRGMTEDDFPDGMAGDFQLPDLVCTNCCAVYQFTKFRNRSKG